MVEAFTPDPDAAYEAAREEAPELILIKGNLREQIDQHWPEIIEAIEEKRRLSEAIKQGMTERQATVAAVRGFFRDKIPFSPTPEGKRVQVYRKLLDLMPFIAPPKITGLKSLRVINRLHSIFLSGVKPGSTVKIHGREEDFVIEAIDYDGIIRLKGISQTYELEQLTLIN